ncbi:hypothetical protein Vafri_12202 [Volvox africanus]|uniref:Uncharacterized protein n=1 Tax=Volvox africanus TaxID=51714 RepID=A0A8J4BAI0_9CHLO|nr:hypothetical protein Vafri_12202 [Volvox africanus]
MQRPVKLAAASFSPLSSSRPISLSPTLNLSPVSTLFSRWKVATASEPRIRRLSGTLQFGSGIRKPVAGSRSSGQRSSTKSVLTVVATCQLSSGFSSSVDAELSGFSSGGGGRPKADMIATVPTASGLIRMDAC